MAQVALYACVVFDHEIRPRKYYSADIGHRSNTKAIYKCAISWCIKSRKYGPDISWIYINIARTGIHPYISNATTQFHVQNFLGVQKNTSFVNMCGLVGHVYFVLSGLFT